jgi:hypothetical protein
MPTPGRRWMMAHGQSARIRRRMYAPSFVIMAELSAGTLNSSAANFSTAVKGAASGTLSTLNGSLGSLVNVILKDTLAPEAAAAMVVLVLREARVSIASVSGLKSAAAPPHLLLRSGAREQRRAPAQKFFGNTAGLRFQL